MALVLLTTLLALCIAAGIYAAVDLYNSAENRYVNQALPLRTATRDLVLQMVNEETGVRGYMISRRRDQLRPFFNGTLGVHQDLGTISRLSRDNPTLRRRTVLLRREITSVESWLKRQITFVGDSVAGQKRAQMDLPQGQAYFNRFRSTASLLNGDVDRLVAATRERQRRTFVGTLVALIAAGVGALLISLTLLRRFPEQVRQSYAQEEEGRLRAEQQANAARALAHIQDAVVLFDDAGRIQLWNPAAEEVFGIPAEDVVERTAETVVPELDAIETASRDRGLVVPVQVHGADRWVSAASTAFDGGRVLAVRDLTSEYELERIRNDFVATASHELRTPVAAVYGAAQTLIERSATLSPATRRRLMQVIEEEARRLVNITDQMLATAELDQGRLTLNTEECDVRALCQSVIESARLRHPGGVPISLVGPTALAPIEADSQRLRQVVVNLVDNAIKYSPDGGRVELRLEATPDTVSIVVADEGLGIAADEQERIFEKFYRVDPQMKRGIGGSGLGLYLSRQIVERMGGTLTVSSEHGAGSAFTIELPRERARTVGTAAVGSGEPAPR
jgi:two-component system phosphate regulon sensor histidine kinase PhoR